MTGTVVQLPGGDCLLLRPGPFYEVYEVYEVSNVVLRFANRPVGLFFILPIRVIADASSSALS